MAYNRPQILHFWPKWAKTGRMEFKNSGVVYASTPPGEQAIRAGWPQQEMKEYLKYTSR
jgi:hypothetical protein